MTRAFAATVLAIVVAAFLVLVALATNGCSQPKPKPTPGPDAGVVDMFAGKIWNCRLPVVAAERDSAVGDVRWCLLQGPQPEPVNACAVKQATANYAPTTVACLVRDVGARCNAAYLAGAADPAEKACADAARAWITGHAVGYISVETGAP